MRRDGWILLTLAAATLAVFWRVSRHEFVNYDDYAYVTMNREVQQGLTWENVKAAFGQLHGQATYWHPVTWLSHMLDCQLFGLNPAGHHLGNLFFHTLNTLLLFVLWRTMTGARGRSAMLAALFALHPLQVDSIAWVAERKNVLSTLFWMLTLLAYVRYAARPRWTRYLPVFVLMAFGLMAKPTLVTLPCVLLLLDFWPLGRWRFDSEPTAAHEPARVRSPAFRRSGQLQPAEAGTTRWPPPQFRARLGWLLLEKAPLLALSFASSLVTLRAHEALGALISARELPVSQRLANAVVTYVIYLRKVVWPVDLSVFYMHPGHWPTAAVVGSGILLLAITALALWQLRPRPFLLVGWLWFLGVLVPTIGLVQAHVQAMADRFAYVPVIGVFTMLVWSVADLAARWPQRQWVLPSAAGLALIACVVMSSLQLRYWRNSLTLLEHAVQLAPNDHVAQVMLGNALYERGRLDEALERYLESVRLRPDYAEAWQRAAVALSQKQRIAEAIQHFRTAARLSPNWTEPHRGLAQVLASHGRVEEARAEYQTLAQLLPADANGQMRLAEMLAEGQQWAEAVQRYQEALRQNPNLPPALNNLAWLRATCPQAEFRDAAEAVRLAERACQLTRRRNPYFVGTLAAAYAEAGRFPEALRTIAEAEALVGASGSTQLLSTYGQMRALFQAEKPFHEGGN